MKGSGAKRALLAILAACLAVLCLLFARRSVDTQMTVEREYPRENPALSLRQDRQGVIYVEGEGKLYANDLKALLKMAGIHSRDVNSIVVGDGITEIGYKVFNRMKYLETLKLGSGVTRVAPGGLNYCASLGWLFIPSGLREIGGGFLYGCNNCRVVTDARSGELPTLENVRQSERIIGEVDSLAALRAAVGEDVELPDALANWWR